jgi:uncharacterized protein (TIGR03437 family)
MKIGIAVIMLSFCVVFSRAQPNLFTLGGTFPTGVGFTNGYPAGAAIVTADFNRDGNADIVTANYHDGTLTVLLGDGRGNFTQSPGSPIAAPNNAVSAIGEGDFNKDGYPDLVLANSAGTYILLGDGKGGFALGTEIPSAIIVGGYMSLVVADFNGDGNLDVLIYGTLSSSRLFFGNGAGGFSPSSDALGPDVTDAVAGDFRGDGNVGLAAVNTFTNNGQLMVVAWNGANAFQTIYNQFGPSVGSVVGAGAFEGGSQSDAVYFTSNSGVDVRCWTWSFSSVNDLGNLVWSQMPSMPTSMATGDFNGDGKLDWAGTDPYSGTVITAVGDGTGAFAVAPGSPYVVGGTPYGIVAADFNGDGKVDLAVDTGLAVVVLLNSTPPASGPLPFVSSVVNAASYAARFIAPESYAAAFGNHLAASAGDPTVKVAINDANGNRASANVLYAGPGQVNFLVPAGVAVGTGSLEVSNSVGASIFYPITVESVAPGLFTVDSAGKIPAAQVLSLDASNQQTFQPVANCSGGTCTLVPVVLNSADQNYLILYGTGIRGNGGTSGVTVTFGDAAEPAAYAGPQGEYPGLDQVNVPIPQSLVGQGQVKVTLSIASVGFQATSNTVEVEFQ